MDGCFALLYKHVMASLVAVIDDDNSVRESLESLIRSAGFAVRVFDSAEQFLNSPYLRKVAYLVSDVRMPGMSGTELHRYMLSNGCEVPVIFITAYAADDEARALTNGALAYLIKPFDEGELLRAIHRALKSDSKQDD
jgi:FixJ family two-component response regulator